MDNLLQCTPMPPISMKLLHVQNIIHVVESNPVVIFYREQALPRKL